MNQLPLESVETMVRGAQSCVRENARLLPLRLPAWAWSQIPDALTAETFRHSSGVRLEMTTEATVIELDLSARRIRVEGLDLPTYACAVDVLVDGAYSSSQTIETVGVAIIGDSPKPRIVEAPVQTLRFDQLRPGTKHVAIWLPANAAVALYGLRADAVLAPASETAPRWVHYGSSISHCAEADRPTETWPAVAARAGGFALTNLGVGGACHLDPFVARVIRQLPAECISLKIGINIVGGDTMKHRTFVPALHGFVDAVREGHPDVPLLLVSPIVCPVLEDAQGPLLFDGRRAISAVAADGANALTLRRTREIIEGIVETRRQQGDSQLFYLDGLRLFGPHDIDELPDGLHPSATGYVRLGQRFARSVFESGGPFAAHATSPRGNE